MIPALLVLTDASESGAMFAHDPGPGHPECPDRLRDALIGFNGVNGVTFQAPSPATRAQLLRVHTPAHVDALLAHAGQRFRIDDDTAGSPRTIEAALLSAGAAIDAVEAALAQAGRTAWAVTRPPGHHAEPDRAMGFCFFSNAALAAAHAVEALGLSRVLVFDWDVHHGNGTQRAFDARADVLFIDIHEQGNWPGTGAPEEVGVGDGAGFTAHVELPSGSGDADALAAVERVLVPLARAYRPELILVSAGFDAHLLDPLGGLHLSADGFGAMAARVRALAGELCGGRVALVLEGGYHRAALCECVGAVARALVGKHLGRIAGPPQAAALASIERTRRALAPFWEELRGYP